MQGRYLDAAGAGLGAEIEMVAELVLEEGNEAVTIKDIVERANVGRSTFCKDELQSALIQFWWAP